MATTYNNLYMDIRQQLRMAGVQAATLEDRELVRTTLRNLFYVGIFLLSVAFLVDASYNPFLYFRF